MRKRVSLLLLLLLRSSRAQDEVLVCNSLAKETYALYPVVNTEECMSLNALNQEDESLYCVGKWFQKLNCESARGRIKLRTEKCSALRARLDDQTLGINARMPKPLQMTVDSVLTIDKQAYASNDFVPFTTALVKWRSVALLSNSALPGALFGGAAL